MISLRKFGSDHSKGSAHKNIVNVLNTNITSNSSVAKTLLSIHLSSNELLRADLLLPLYEH